MRSKTDYVCNSRMAQIRSQNWKIDGRRETVSARARFCFVQLRFASSELVPSWSAAGWTCFAPALDPMATTKSLLEAFSHFDTDGSGKLDGETNPGAADFWGDGRQITLCSPALVCLPVLLQVVTLPLHTPPPPFLTLALLRLSSERAAGCPQQPLWVRPSHR